MEYRDAKLVVSVIIPTYNNSATIIRALESVFNQSYTSTEIIVVDDGSMDNTREVLSSYIENKQITYFYQKNSGCGAARNLGIRHAHGEYVAFLDADDYWHSEKLDLQVSVFQNNPEIKVCYTESYCIDPYSPVIWQTKRDTINAQRSGSIVPFLVFHNMITLSSVLLKKEAVLEVGGFTEIYDRMMFADLDLWLKLAPIGKFYAITTPLTFYQLRGPISLVQIKHNHRVMREIFYDSIFRAPWAAKPWYGIGWLRESLLYIITLWRPQKKN